MVRTRSNRDEDNHREETGETSNPPPPPLTAEQINQLIANAVQDALAQVPEQEEIRQMREELEELRNRAPPRPELTAQQQEEMRRMREEIDRLRETADARAPAPDRGSPFTPAILAAPLPRNFQFPDVGKYDGMADPHEHLAQFENATTLYQCADAIKCRVFPMTLTGAAQSWFQKLPEGQTGSFEDLRKAFHQRFASSKKQPTTSLNLLSIKQTERESLREYVGRFNKVLIEVPTVTPELLVGAFTQGMKGGDFFKSLVKKPPATFEELLSRSEKYINLEEADLHRKTSGRPSGRGTSDPRGVADHPRGRYPDPPRLVKTAVKQIAWKVSRSRALQICDERGLVRRPRNARGPTTMPSDTYCDFHRQYGHNTDDCYTLDAELERIAERDSEVGAAIKDGVPLPPLKRPREEPVREQEDRNRKPYRGNQPPTRRGYMPNDRGIHRTERGKNDRGRVSPDNRGQANNHIKGVIKIISGGPVAGDSNRARKAGYRRLVSEEVSIVEKRGGPTISFGPNDFHGGTDHHDDALVIEGIIANYKVERIFVDNGSSANILFKEAMDLMDLGEYKMEKVETDLFGFTGHFLTPIGMIQLPVTFGTRLTKTQMLSFAVIDHDTSYNVILGRPGINAFGAVPSALHQKMKFPVGREVGEALGDRRVSRKCYIQEVRIEKKAQKSRRNDGPRSCTRGQMYSINSTGPVDTDDKIEEVVLKAPSGSVKVAADLPEELKSRLIRCLRKNEDVFAWSTADLIGVDRGVMEHKLNVSRDIRPVFQKKRSFGVEQNNAIREQVTDLLKAGHIREVQFPTWLSNVVMVPKSTGKWRMCVDFRDLNKACPKDCYPLPRIDQLVDSTAGHELLCFLDAYQGYHQIKLAPEDQEKVSFVTNDGTFCYVVMPFGLKNAGATYQRLMDKVFQNQIGRNVEVYVDDILIKSRTADSFLADLEETFSTARRYKLKLNPNKCTFGVRTGKFLGYMVTRRGIEANPEKIQALATMTSPRNVNEVQRLAGRITALSRFISRSAERSLPFFKVLRKVKNFEWDQDAEAAFQELKEYLRSLPILNKPVQGEDLVIYLAITRQAVSSVLVREEGTNHLPIYFVSYALKGSELNYTTQEKLAFALVLTARRLRPYFLSHSIIVLTNSTLGRIMSHPDTSGRLVKWATELGEFDIQYRPRVSIKAQILADFLVETIEMDPEEQWRIQVDGSTRKSGSGVGIVLISPWGEETNLAVRLDFRGTNNVIEYEALMIGLRAAKVLGAARVKLLSDSELVVQQSNGNFEVRDPKMAKYARALERMREDFEEIILEHVERGNNEKADGLAKLASAVMPSEQPDHLMVELVSQIERVGECTMQIEAGDWRYEIFMFLAENQLPSDEARAREVKRRASRFVILNGVLYKRSFSRPLLKCLSSSQATQVLKEIHEGICGSHLGGMALAREAVIAGFFWPTMQKDAMSFARSCYSCQTHANLQRAPAAAMKSVIASCPFDQWGMDIVGPFPNTPGQRRHLIVAIDYFSKWVEAEAVVKTAQEDVMNFLWKNIFCRFGIPRRLISDNGPQFTAVKMREWCKELKIEQVFSSIAHPESNGQVEVTNRTIVQALKARIGEKKGNWADELQSILWSFRTSPRTGTNETPFSLVYGSEAVLPAEVGQESARILGYSTENNQIRALELDLIEENRERALVRMAAYQNRIARAYNRRMRPKTFEVGDMVMREIQHEGVRKKMEPKYEGPFKIVAKAGVAAYYLEEEDGKRSNRPWNARLLKKYYC